MASYVEGEAPETDSEDEQYLFNLSYMKIGNDNVLESPNVAVSSTSDLILKGNVVDGVTETEDLLQTPVATELTEDFSPTKLQFGTQESYSSHENERIRRTINEQSINILKNFIQDRIAPISKKMIETDRSLINTQLTLENVSTSMKHISECSSKINAKFSAVMENDFLPQINKLP